MTATVIAAAATVLVVASALTVLLRVGGGRGSDQPARAMARPGTLTEITGRSAKAKAERLRPGMVVTKPSDYGIRVGVSVQGGHPLYLSWEDVGTVLAGTRMGKTAAARKVWSENQFEALRSASNIEYYGGGISDTGYLESVSRRIGDHDVQRWSTSVGRGGDRTRSQSWSREPIMALDQLAALPKDRALVMTSGNPPVLVRKTFWQDGPHAAGIRASLARYDTTPTRTTPPRDTTATAPRGTSSPEPA